MKNEPVRPLSWLPFVCSLLRLSVTDEVSSLDGVSNVDSVSSADNFKRCRAEQMLMR